MKLILFSILLMLALIVLPLLDSYYKIGVFAFSISVAFIALFVNENKKKGE